MQIIENTLILSWAIFFTYWFSSALRDRAPLKRTPGRISLLTAIAVPIMLLSLIVGLYVPEILTERFLPDSLPLALAGMVLTLCGLGFAVWARKHLGKSWTGQPAIREDHKIVRTGPYSTVRNPIYTGTLLAIAGSTIATGYLAGVLVLVIAFSIFLVKIRMEERFLEDEFGEDYAGYKREVRALVPFLI
jgi:protein-S-isoprenylcysteine O-methyltransferase Ste14